VSSTGAILLYFLLVNVMTYLAFGLDKYFAVKGMWRIAEAKLLLMSFLGGSVGGFAGSRVFRHKTRKEPFRSYFRAIVLLQVLVAGTYFVPPFRELAIRLIDFLTR
jgi:uncharacterized membrane protein YsdA (DUF1294 family)